MLEVAQARHSLRQPRLLAGDADDVWVRSGAAEPAVAVPRRIQDPEHHAYGAAAAFALLEQAAGDEIVRVAFDPGDHRLQHFIRQPTQRPLQQWGAVEDDLIRDDRLDFHPARIVSSLGADVLDLAQRHLQETRAEVAEGVGVARAQEPVLALLV